MPIFCRLHWDTSFSRSRQKTWDSWNCPLAYIYDLTKANTAVQRSEAYFSCRWAFTPLCREKQRNKLSWSWNNTNWRASQPSERASESLSFLSLRRMKVNKSPWKKKFFISPVCVYLSRRHALNCRANREDKKLLAHCAGRMIVLLWSSKPLFYNWVQKYLKLHTTDTAAN